MSDIEVWLVIALITVATFISRSSMWLVGHHINLPKRVQEALRYAPSCALAAIILPDLLLVNEQVMFHWHNPKLIAGIMAILFFYFKRNMLLTIFFGMLVFTVARIYL
jgi:branched-subunit amino acid transport protein